MSEETRFKKKVFEIVSDLSLKNRDLYQRITELNEINEEYRKLNGELRKENNILIKFKEWLEEETDKAIGTEYSVFVDCLDKLQELKEGNNEV